MADYRTNEKKDFVLKTTTDSTKTYQADVVVLGQSTTFSASIVNDGLSITLNNFDPLGSEDFANGFIRFYDNDGVTLGVVYVDFYKPTTTDKDVQALQAIEAVLQGRATKEQASYSVNGRSISYFSIDELLRLRAYYIKRINGQSGSIQKGYIF